MGIIRPLVFIGCGGSGGKTLRFTHDAILRRLRRFGWTGMPAAWQFLWIDVPELQEGGEEYGAQLPAECYVGLVKPSTTYSTGIDQAVMSIRNTDPMELVGWRPDPDGVFILIEDGAGQYRAIGRMITIRNGKRVAEAVRWAYQATSSGPAQEELTRLGELLQSDVTRSPRAFIASSLAGGSGAGTFLDVADVLAIESGATDSISALLYTADVFTGDKSITGVEGVEGNSLAALSELLAGYWSSEERKLSVFRSQGISTRSLNRGAISFPFLVGATNASGVTLDSSTEVYRAIGEALGLIAVSGEVQESFTRFLTTQWPVGGSSNSDRLGIQGRSDFAPCSALGYSRIGLGRDRFEDYAVRRLARAAVEFLSTGWLRTARSDVEGQTQAETLQTIVDENKLAFLGACELDERGDRNQITDALTPPSLNGLLKDVIYSVADKQKSAEPTDLSNWLKRIRDTEAVLVKEFNSSFDAALGDVTAKWSREAPGRLLEAVTDYVARFGLQVVLELLSWAKGELLGVAEDLLKEAGSRSTEADNWRGRVGQLELPMTDRIGPEHPQMAHLIEAVTSPTRYLSLKSIAERASTLMTEFAREVIAPLETTLAAAAERFEEDTKAQKGHPPEYVTWPKDTLVPDMFQPSKVEFLLEDVAGYPEKFMELVAASTTKEEMELGASPLSVAVRKVISGGFRSRSVVPIDYAIRRDPMGLKPENIPPWGPKIAAGLGEQIKFMADFSVDQIYARAVAWTESPGLFRDYVEESLSDYLQERDANGDLIADHPERLSTFAAKFTTALASSSPLIDVDRNIYSVTHPNDLELARLIEPLPFAKDHPARRVAEDVLIKAAQSGGGSTVPDDSFFTSNDAQIGSVGIITYFAQPMHPVVFKSVTAPIDAKLQTDISKFWTWRRTRRLSEFVPISSNARRAMIRGWFNARALGLLNVPEPGGETAKAIQILSDNGDWLAFPTASLGGQLDRRSLPVAVVLESLPLVLIAWSAGRFEEIEPYRRLLKLGLSDPSRLADDQTSTLFAYQDANPELLAWVATGQSPTQATPRVQGATQEDRRDSVVKEFGAMAENLAARIKLEGTESTKLLQAPRGVDLIDEVTEELARLIAARYVINTTVVD